MHFEGRSWIDYSTFSLLGKLRIPIDVRICDGKHLNLLSFQERKKKLKLIIIYYAYALREFFRCDLYLSFFNVNIMKSQIMFL